MKNIFELCEKINSEESENFDMSSLPTFGGVEPEDTNGIFSWGENHYLVQVSEGFKVISRESDADFFGKKRTFHE